jgi:serine/threonine-protein kinase
MRISFGPFAFDPQSRLLWRDGTEIALPPRVLGVLEILLERSGEVVPRQDLLDRVWKDAFVTDTSLAEAVSFLRSALGDDTQAPTYIQTVHRRGYRFLVTPEATVQPAAAPAARSGSNAGRTGVEPASDPSLARVRQGPDRGQTGVRPGSDLLRQTFAQPAGVQTAEPDADWTLVPWSIALLCAGLAAAGVWFAMRAPAPETPPVARLELRAAPGTAFDRDLQPIAISPDGRSIAWSACEIASGRCAIYVRALDALEPRALAGTDGGHSPVFSPDARWIAFFADGAIKKIAVAGGAPTTLASAPDPAGAAWSADGRIAFAGSAAGGLSVVNGESGVAQALTRVRSQRDELRHRNPAWLPDGTLLFTIASAPGLDVPGELAATRLSSDDIHLLRRGVTRAAPAGPGYLLLATAADLQAAAFDERALALTGPTDAVPVPAGGGAPRFAAGSSALAVVQASRPPDRAWTDGVDATPLARLTQIAIAPDSRRAAGVIVDNDRADVWVADLTSNGLTRMTFGGTNVSPAWSPDGRRLFYAARDDGGIFRAVSRDIADRNAPPAPVASAPAQAFPSSVSGDGSVALTIYRDGRTTVAIAAHDGGSARVLTDGPFDEAAAVFSPDGRWIALESTESGRSEVVVRASTGGQRQAISSEGGRHPRWSGDGRSIYFESGRRLMEAAFVPDGSGAPSRPAVMVDHAVEQVLAVTPSGRVLVERQPPAEGAVFVLQWLRELRERLPLPVNAPR